MMKNIADKYQLIRLIGEGGMASVHLARQLGIKGFEKIVAIKTILPHMLRDPEAVNMFTDEARIAAQLNHANIVQVYDFGVEEDAFYIALEYVHGCSLATLLKNLCEKDQKLPTGLTLYIMSKICKGLAFAHSKTGLDGTPLSIIHRDLDPQNVLLSYDGDVKIGDFGLAKAENQSHQSITGDIKGKASYMSPELLKGLKLDQRADLFAVGVIFFEMLTGKRPFSGDHMYSTMHAIMEGERLQISQIDPEIPAPIAAIVEKSLVTNREERYQTAQEMLDDIERERMALSSNDNSMTLAAFLADLLGDVTKQPIMEQEKFASSIQDEPTIVPIETSKTGEQDIQKSRNVSTKFGGGQKKESFFSFRKPYVWLFLVLLIAAVAVFVLMNNNKPDQMAANIETPTPAIENTPEPVTPTPVPEETTPEETPEPTPEKETTPAAKIEPSYLIAKVSPADAKIYIGGQAKGTGPAVGPIKIASDKKFYVKADLAGYAAKTVPVTVAPGKTKTVTLTLDPVGKGALSANADAAAKVFVDGTYIGDTPIANYEIPSGSHTVTFQSKVIETPVSKQVKVMPGKTAKASAKFLATLEVNCVPWANVYLDGAKIGVTPLVKTGLKPGIYSVRLHNPELGKEANFTKEFKSGKTISISHNLAK